MGMEPWQSWAVVMAIGGGAAWYYYGSRQPRKRATERPHAAGNRAESRAGRSREEGKGRRRKEQPAKTQNANDSADAMSSGVEKPADHQSDQTRPGKQKKDAKGTVSKHADKDRDTSSAPRDKTDADNKEFAKRMLGVKTGTSLATKERDGSRPRTVAPQRAEENTSRLSVNQPSSRELSRTSSTTGGDADDDWSPARSPALEATPTDPQPVSGGDVSDMLAAPAPGPSVLRITPATQPSTAVRSHAAPKAAAPQETKKQRQNRRKAEEKKEARAAAEAERRVQLEKQRRTAREAEGRPAKNGLGMVSSKPTGPSPWASNTTSGPPANNNNEIATGGAVLDQQPLLETFDRAPQTASNSTNQGTGPSTRTSVDSNGTQASSIWDRDMPSEEDQMRMLQEMEDGAGWSTVLKGKKNNKKSKGSDGRATGNETSESETKDRPVGHGGDAVRQQENAKPTTTTSSGGAVMGSGNANGFARPAHPADSDWAVL